MSESLALRTDFFVGPVVRHPAPVVPWRDPQTVSPGELAGHVERLELAVAANPRSADLRTSLGMAYAVGYEVTRSMDALEAAVTLDPAHFWAQMKYAELHYRLRALPRAQTETLKAVALARNPWELKVARTQLQEIRTLLHLGTRDVAFDKPLLPPVLVLVALLLAACLVMLM